MSDSRNYYNTGPVLSINDILFCLKFNALPQCFVSPFTKFGSSLEAEHLIQVQALCQCYYSWFLNLKEG